MEGLFGVEDERCCEGGCCNRSDDGLLEVFFVSVVLTGWQMRMI